MSMAAWRDCKLGDLLHIKHGYALLGEHFGDKGSHIVVTPGSFYDAGGFKHKGDKEKWYSGPVPEDYVLKEGDVVIAMTEQAEGLLGSSAIIPKSGLYLHNQRIGLIQIRDPQSADSHFLYYLFNSKPVRQHIRGSASGTKIRHTAPSRVADVPVTIPPLPVQRRIAGILSAYDELIENSQRRIRLLEDMARALYREWFVHFRFPGHESVPRLPSALGDIPQGWEVKTVEEIVKRIPVGKKYDLKTVSPTGAVPVFDQGKSGIIGFHDDEPGVVASETAPVIVFANHTCYQRLVQIPFSAIQNVLPFIPNPAQPRNIYWLHWATNGLVVFNDYKGHWPEFEAKTLVVPPSDLCQRFGCFAAPLSRQILKLEHQIQNLRHTRDLLLPRLLSGQVNLKEN
jgi:type I restriction enzyme S subunit